MIATFTDFGWGGPYLGQLRVVLAREAPGVLVVDLLADAPRFDPVVSAYLLAALAPELPPGAVCLAVVDPGVGTQARRPVIVRAGGHWFVGPDNGLLQVVAMRGPDRDRWEVLWRPGRLSASFHGRDLFAPVAARLARGEWPAARPIGWSPADFEGWADDLARVIYVDAYGNAVTGLRTAGLAPGARFAVAGQVLERAETFGAVPPGTGLWYENSSGLAEIAVNQGSAASLFGLAVGSPVTVTG